MSSILRDTPAQMTPLAPSGPPPLHVPVWLAYCSPATGRSNEMKRLLASIIMSAALVASLGCSNWNRMTPKALDNTSTASEVKKNLVADHVSVDVDVTDGVVTLTGHLPTAADRQQAYDDAAKVTGVKNVVNHIDVP